MAHSPSAEPCAPIVSAQAGEVLLDLAEESIRDGLAGRSTPPVDLTALPAELREPFGCFVSVHVDGDLNGCIGTLEPAASLAHEVQRMARSAAFSDPRLPALRSDQFERAVIEVSVLSAMQPIKAGSRAELFAVIRPRIDGLVLSTRGHRGLFLPVVWEQLPNRDQFLDHLIQKAGMRPVDWRPDLRAERFTTTVFERHRGAAG